MFAIGSKEEVEEVHRTFANLRTVSRPDGASLSRWDPRALPSYAEACLQILAVNKPLAPRSEHRPTPLQRRFRNFSERAFSNNTSFGLMECDGKVLPHPPVIHALHIFKEALQETSYDVGEPPGTKSRYILRLTTSKITSFARPYSCRLR